LGPSYAHQDAAGHPNVRAGQHTHADSPADSDRTAFRNADGCHGHRHGDACDGDRLGHPCSADSHFDADECAADGDLYPIRHADGDERSADGHRDEYADTYAYADAGAAAALTGDGLRSCAGDFLKEFSRHGFVCVSQKTFRRARHLGL
jgi:hypothetical protein